MAAISRANELKQLLPGLNALFGEEYNRYENEHEEIYVTENSERSFEEELKLSGFGAAPVKDEGSAITYDTAQESFVARYTHETIGLGFSIIEEAMEDNLYVSVSARYTKALARAMSYTKQVKAAYPLNNGFSTTFSSGDGVALFSTAHPLVNGGTNSNRPSTGADLNETSLEDAIIQIGKWTDERGLKIAARPKKLIVPSDLQFVATRLLQSDYRVGTADNDINAIKTNGVRSEEHTSELQSRLQLVYRLLLEKKKPKKAVIRRGQAFSGISVSKWSVSGQPRTSCNASAHLMKRHGN